MLRNYLKTAFRHLSKNKLYSTINVFGLAAGICCTLLAVFYWTDEHSFDKFHKNNPHIYRITSSFVNEKGERRPAVGSTGHVHGPAFKAGTPEVKHMTRVMGGDIETAMVAADKTIGVKPLWVDSSFFDIFSFGIIQGNAATALKEINSVVLTESLAKKFFNSTDVVGKLLAEEASPSFKALKKPLVVTAVVKDPPGNSSLQFDCLLTFSFMELSFQSNNWFGTWLSTFVLLHPDANLEKVQEKFNVIYARHAKAQVNDPEMNWMSYDPKGRYGLQPMTDLHFNTHLAADGWNESGVVNLAAAGHSYVFMGIALFILAMATINFVNISIAGSLKRAKEVGMRKISGGKSSQIILQFLVESAILCFIAFLIAILLMGVLLPLFNAVTGKGFHFIEIFDWQLLTWFGALFLLVILLNGLYPAVTLSKFEAVKVLYNKPKTGGRNILGRSLVVVQFALAIFLVAGTIVYYSQMNFIRTKDLGYNPSSIFTTSVEGDRGDYNPIISYLGNELRKEPSIKAVSFGNNYGSGDVEINNRKFSALNKAADDQFLSLMEIPLLSGKNVSDADKNGVIVNEAFVKAAGLQHPIGENILSVWFHDSTYRRIVGVFKDYHTASLREPIKPLIIKWPENAAESYVQWIKSDRANQQKALAATARIFKTILPGAIYQYEFLDEKNAAGYKQERRWQKVINFASVLAFILCSLGLFGLAHLSTHQRVKEIGVRKVLGASVGQIVSLFTQSFLKLVILAILISLPVARIVADRWLENFAYRIDVSWWMLALAGFTAIFIAIVTVSMQAINAALVNPVKSLTTE
ncbi:ABC transporter permease [Chitinophaga cymbidii]|uniref:ABC transporter permease n=1 Tax=Chitinophaga cymbidii TaxID=1096750 RepID=A0A512REE6_9BACT|nr:ABC transporter permease [Chitinophaga cymbidii]GEP94062.1 ABC transporter permease [Chitinophaga cymbidii]